MPFGTVISQYLGSHFAEKERNHWMKFFSSSENAIWSILLKYQEIDVHLLKYQEIDVAFTDQLETSSIVSFLNGIKSLHFILAQSGNSIIATRVPFEI